uniref:SFRICE_002419 n=1 Tax=Spodoptera frugiperda TaxID=7108 RepID=A0A2H1WJF4_SPOFR
MTSSPRFKHLEIGPKRSPIEIKEKMRKNYKNKIQNCRVMLMDKLRGSLIEEDLCTALTDIYKSMFNFSDEIISDEEYELIEELKKELVQEELEWCMKEYEKSQQENVDWSLVEEDNNVICPVCQKTNLQLQIDCLTCSNCKSDIKTKLSLSDIKKSLLSSLEAHNASCNNDAQFGVVSEENESHIYLICESCSEMKLIL